MKLKKGFVTHTIGTDQLMVAVGAAAKQFPGMVSSNETAAFIVECLKNQISEEGIVDRLLEEYDVDRQTAAKDVADILGKLRSIGAIE